MWRECDRCMVTLSSQLITHLILVASILAGFGVTVQQPSLHQCIRDPIMWPSRQTRVWDDYNATGRWWSVPSRQNALVGILHFGWCRDWCPWAHPVAVGPGRDEHSGQLVTSWVALLWHSFRSQVGVSLLDEQTNQSCWVAILPRCCHRPWTPGILWVAYVFVRGGVWPQVTGEEEYSSRTGEWAFILCFLRLPILC
jgi:hypothetical protein